MLGVTFDGFNSGTFGGIGNGDPGNWGLNGTNGPQFLGNNGVHSGDTYVESIYFAVGQTTISFDASRANGSRAAQTLTVIATASNNFAAIETLTLGDINGWTTFSLTGSGPYTRLTRLDLSSSGPHGIDNLQFNTVPEPSLVLVLAVMLLGLGVAASPRPAPLKALAAKLQLPTT